MTAGMGARLSILIYHRVLARPDPLVPDQIDAGRFERQIALLKRCFHLLPLGCAVRALRNGTLAPRAACITFDDGYADNADIALPILRRHGVRASFFIASDYLDGGRMWNDQVIEHVRAANQARLDLTELGLGILPIATERQKAVAIDAMLSALKYRPHAERLAYAGGLGRGSAGAPLMLRTEQVQLLRRAGMEIGAHTASHPILAVLPDQLALNDIARGRLALEAIIDGPVRAFAYPNGKPERDYDGRHVAMLRALGFELALSTVPGAAHAGSDPFQLPRFTPWERSRVGFWLRLQHSRFSRTT